jgi:hypothetical protein
VLDLPASSPTVRHPNVELQLHLGRRRFVQGNCRNVIRGLDDLIPLDSQNGEYGNLVTAGIIDPTKVVRVAIQNAASVAAHK